MDNIFLSELKIEHVRHLKNITISLSDKKIKHLILTGKNGSGKTSVLEALARYLDEERLVRLAGSRYDSNHGGDVGIRMARLQLPRFRLCSI
nr:AAA family ATPase [uncultured Acetatifactor sp.]